MSEKEITIEIRNPELIILLIFSVIILALELQITFTKPISFGDEGFHSYLAKLIGEQKNYFVWMPFEGTTLIHSGYTRPPLWNLLEASFIFIFGFNEIIIRFLTPFIVTLTSIAAYLLVKRVLNEKVAFITSVILITLPSFVTYSVLFYTDILFTFYATLTLLTFLLAEKENSKKYFLLSGVFGALAFLTKLPGAGFYAFFALVFLYELIKKRKLLMTIKKFFPLLIILLIIPAGFFLRSFYYYHSICIRIPFIGGFDTSGCSINNFESKYKFTGRTEQAGTEASVYKIGLMSYLDFAYGTLWFVPLGFISGLIILLIKREKLTNYLLLYLLLFFILFPAVVGRAEDTARYTLAWAPLIALVTGRWYEEIYEFLKKNQKYLGIVILIFVLVFAYLNASEKLTTMSLVKQFSPTFFEACNWIKENTPENSSLYTVWAHRAVYNCQRNSVGTGTVPDLALSRDVDYTLQVAKENGVTHFFIQKFSIDSSNRHLSEKYDLDWVQFLESHPEAFVKVYDDKGWCTLRDPSGRIIDQRLAGDIAEALMLIQRGYYCDGNVVYWINTTGVV